jgi:hypothetical protein
VTCDSDDDYVLPLAQVAGVISRTGLVGSCRSGCRSGPHSVSADSRSLPPDLDPVSRARPPPVAPALVLPADSGYFAPVRGALKYPCKSATFQG